MGQITWREIGTPNVGASADLMRTAGDLMNKGFAAGVQGLNDYTDWQTRAESGKVMAFAAQQQDPAALKEALASGTALGGIDLSRVNPEAIKFLNQQQGVLFDTVQKQLQNKQTEVLTTGYGQQNALRDATFAADVRKPYLANETAQQALDQARQMDPLLLDGQRALNASNASKAKVDVATEEARIRKPFLENETNQFKLDKDRDDKRVDDEQMAAQGPLNARLAEIDQLRRTNPAAAQALAGSAETAAMWDAAGYKPKDYQDWRDSSGKSVVNIGDEQAGYATNALKAQERIRTENVKRWLDSLMTGENMASSAEQAKQRVAADGRLSAEEKADLNGAIDAAAKSGVWPTKSDGVVDIPGEQRQSLVDLVPRQRVEAPPLTTTAPSTVTTNPGTAVSALEAAAGDRTVPSDPAFRAAAGAVGGDSLQDGRLRAAAPPTPAVMAAAGSGRLSERALADAAQKTYRDRNQTSRGPTVEAAGYDVVVGNGKYGKPPQPLTTMTLEQVDRFGRDTLIPNTRAARVGVLNGKVLGASASGKYQMVGGTMLEAARDLGMDPRTTVFTPEVQDRLAIQVANKYGLTRWEGLTKNPAAMERARAAQKAGDYPAMLAAIAGTESGSGRTNDVALASSGSPSVDPATGAAGSRALAQAVAPDSSGRRDGGDSSKVANPLLPGAGTSGWSASEQAEIAAAQKLGPAAAAFVKDQINARNLALAKQGQEIGNQNRPKDTPGIESPEQLLKNAADQGLDLTAYLNKMATANKVDDGFNPGQDFVAAIQARENGKSPLRDAVVKKIVEDNGDLSQGSVQGAINGIIDRYQVAPDLAGVIYRRSLEQNNNWLFGTVDGDKRWAPFQDKRGFSYKMADELMSTTSGKRLTGQALENRLVSLVSQSSNQTKAGQVIAKLAEKSEEAKKEYQTLKTVAARSGNKALEERAEKAWKQAQSQIAAQALATAAQGNVDPNVKTLR
jgi:hypothetical protein